MQIKAFKTRTFHETEALLPFILQYIKKLPEKSVLVITSKIFALSEGRVADLKEKDSLIKQESDYRLRSQKVWLTVKDGMMVANAGIDESNANGRIILLPEDSFKSAQIIRQAFKKRFKIKNLGVIISDSELLPMRMGVIGVAIGYAGFKGVKNYIGKKDIFGRKFKYAKTNVADSLATAATLCMGEGNERRPIALITNVPVEFSNKINKKEMKINSKSDIFYPLLKNLK